MVKHNGFSTVRIAAAILLVIIVGMAGWFAWHAHEDKNKSAAQNTTQPAPGQTTNTISINFPELNFQLDVPVTLKDMIYSVSTPATGTIQANLSTTSLQKLDAKCGPDGHGTPLGWLTRTVGDYPIDASKATGALLKQYPGYYIAYATPQAACTDKKAAQDLSIQQLKTLKDALNQSNFATKIP